MASLLDIIGSTAIGAFIILMLISLNAQINSTSDANLVQMINQSNAVNFKDIILHDYYKIGYRVSGEKIAEADSNRIKFYADLNNDGIKDSVSYYTGNIYKEENNQVSYSLYRKSKSGSSAVSESIDRFKLTYLDSLGQSIAYNKLSNSSSREKIKAVKVYIKFVSDIVIDNTPAVIEWQQTIKPKNLN